MKTNVDIVNYLVYIKAIKDKNIEAAFRAVDRKNFFVEEYKDFAYKNKAMPTLANQTISQPEVVAEMTHYLKVEPGQRILDIGAGSGYQAAILSKLVGENGKVITVERIKELYEFASNNLKDYKNVQVVYGDGFDGYEAEAPYDKILVAAASKDVPKKLFDQLKEGGRIIIPLGEPNYSKLTLIEKKDNEVIEFNLEAVMFVPLLPGKE